MDEQRISKELFDGLAAALAAEQSESETPIHQLIAAYGTAGRFTKIDNPVLSEHEFDAIAKPIRKMFNDN